MPAIRWDPKILCTEITPFRPSVWTHTKWSPFLGQYLVACSCIAPLHCGFKHKKISFPAESPAGSHSRASHYSGQPRVPSPPLWLRTALPLLSPSRSHHSHLQLCSFFRFLASSLLLSVCEWRSGMSPLADLPLNLSHLLHFHRSLPTSPTSSCSIHPPSIRAFLCYSLCHDQHVQSVNHTSCVSASAPVMAMDNFK